MKKAVGLWIDHRKAVVVVVTDKGEEVKQISSSVEKQLRRADASRSKTQYEPLQVPADDMREKALKGHLKLYYDEVISFIRDAESILIFGPGEAKTELKKHLERHKLTARIAGIEAVDRMTDRQIAAKVRQYFLKQSSAIASR
jgi:stalled ribosome rescue protein Dom34